VNGEPVEGGTVDEGSKGKEWVNKRILDDESVDEGHEDGGMVDEWPDKGTFDEEPVGRETVDEGPLDTVTADEESVRGTVVGENVVEETMDKGMVDKGMVDNSSVYNGPLDEQHMDTGILDGEAAGGRTVEGDTGDGKLVDVEFITPKSHRTIGQASEEISTTMSRPPSRNHPSKLEATMRPTEGTQALKETFNTSLLSAESAIDLLANSLGDTKEEKQAILTVTKLEATTIASPTSPPTLFKASSDDHMQTETAAVKTTTLPVVEMTAAIEIEGKLQEEVPTTKKLIANTSTTAEPMQMPSLPWLPRTITSSSRNG
jgi:hypothetical protein